jgi:hypothetical protein
LSYIPGGASEVYPSFSTPTISASEKVELGGVRVDADGGTRVPLFPHHREERTGLDRTGLTALEAARLECAHLQDLDVCHANSVSTRTDIPRITRR